MANKDSCLEIDTAVTVLGSDRGSFRFVRRFSSMPFHRAIRESIGLKIDVIKRDRWLITNNK